MVDFLKYLGSSLKYTAIIIGPWALFVLAFSWTLREITGGLDPTPMWYFLILFVSGLVMIFGMMAVTPPPLTWKQSFKSKEKSNV